MRFVPASCLREGMVIGKNLYDNNGLILLRWGSVLKSSYIEKILEFGYIGVYIQDELTSDLIISNIISDDLRQKTINAAKNIIVQPQKNSNKLLDENFEATKELMEKIIEQVINNKDSMINMIDLKVFDEYTYYHSVNVAVLSAVLGTAFGLNKDQLINLGIGAMLHDIGKMFIDKEILNKPGKLTKEEYEIIKNHTTMGYKYLKSSFNMLPTIYISCLQHHERYDGKGYPNNVKGEKISLYGRIVAICDVYDSLVSKRPYRDAYLPSEAIEYMMANSGGYFDHKLVKLFVKKIAPYPLGTTVTLSNGLIGIVFENYEDACMRPKLKIIRDEKDCEVEPYELNLRKDHNLRNVTIIEVLGI